MHEINCPKDRVDEFRGMMKQTNECMNNYNGDPNHCELIDTHVQSPLFPYTFHTHPWGSEPSEVDKKTTHDLKKKMLCIGVSDENKTVCWTGKNFDKVACEF